MAIFRVEHKKNYTVVNNFICKDNRLSYRAKGIWLYAFSRPDNWTFNTVDLVKQSTDGEKSVKAGLRELEACGYLIREQKQAQDGKFLRSEWIFHETPNEELKEFLPQADFRPAVEREAVNGEAVKDTLLSTDKTLSTQEELNIDRNNNYSAAVSMDIYECLKKVDIPDYDKTEITRRYPEDVVKNALEWATNPLNPPKKSLAASIKYACLRKIKPNPDDMPLDIRIDQNKQVTAFLDGKQTEICRIDVGSDLVEFVDKASRKPSVCIKYSEASFKEKVREELIKNRFISAEALNH